MSDYIPIPVAEAREIAKRYGKDQVLIFAWESKTGKTHITTFGTTPEFSKMAAQGGDKVAELLGLGQMRVHENYLKPEPGMVKCPRCGMMKREDEIRICCM